MPVHTPIEKTGSWLVIVTTDAKGQIYAYAHAGRDPDTAFQEIERAHSDAGGRWMVHWERGFSSKDDAEDRANTIGRELDGSAPAKATRVN